MATLCRLFRNSSSLWTRGLSTTTSVQAEMTCRDALNSAMDEELARDDKVFIIGEEVAEYDGPYKVVHNDTIRTA